MVFTTSRLFTSSISATWAAALKAASVASASPCAHVQERLPGASAQISGAPGSRACAASTTAGSVAYSTLTSSAASWAAASVPATTMTTASPTWRTRSLASIGLGG